MKPVTFNVKLGPRRFLLGLAGPPGSGKSTLAQQIASSYSPRHAGGRSPTTANAVDPPDPGHARGHVAVLPLDGFHRSNAELDRLHLRPIKGSPPTYDVPAFVALLQKLRDESQTHLAPKYCRELHEPVPNAIAIPPEVKLVIVEGNYLLLDTPPWNAVRELLDEVWYMDVPEDLCMARVHTRHLRGGSTPEQATHKIETNDRANYRLIAATQSRAHRIL